MNNQAEEFKVSFGSLQKGVLYPIKAIERTESTFHGKIVKGFKVTLLDDELELVTYLPKKCVENINEGNEFDNIAAAASTDDKYTVCFYGKMVNKETTTFVGRVHKPKEGKDLGFNIIYDILPLCLFCLSFFATARFENLLQSLAKLAEKYFN